MQLDTRRPVLVLLGAWNPAVFSPQWTATHLYGISDGSEITLSILNLQPDNKTITYVQHDVGYYVDNSRFEIYANSFADQSLKKVGDIARTLLTTLPHTPLGDFGINFHFHESDPPTALLDKLTSNDAIDSHFRILAQEFTARILYKEKCQLNFKRVTTGANVIFDFNYHHSVQDVNDFSIISGDYLQSLLNASKSSIKNLYDIDNCDELQHGFARQTQAGEVNS